MKYKHTIPKKILSLAMVSLGFTTLVSAQQPKNAKEIQFEKTQIASESYESVGVFDVNNDGQHDIVSGAFWYQGPEFVKRGYIGEVEPHMEYWDDFLTIPLDVNGDGRTDYVTGGWFSENIRWRENPGDDSEWTVHTIDQTGNVETARGWDVDNDGHIEIVPNNPNDPLKIYQLDRDSNGKPLGTFSKIPIADAQDHGLGFGDVNGDGRGDFIVSTGWLEAPSDMMKGKWVLHEEFELGGASVPILVVDVNGDAKNDLIVGQGHDYGLHWYEQTTDESGKRTWMKHAIDTENSQYHTMDWVDLDGDGQPELVTGKRYRAHNGGDPGGNEPAGLYYFQWDGKGFVKHTISFGPLGKGKGTGIYFSVADLRGTGRQDIIVAGKDGLYVFYNQGDQ
ncbi:MAG: VCBS repeat-containing protein [Cyclobacteriaceae bacterium]